MEGRKREIRRLIIRLQQESGVLQKKQLEGFRELLMNFKIPCKVFSEEEKNEWMDCST